MRVYIGWDASQLCAWNVAAESLRQTASIPVEIERLTMSAIPSYTRPTENRSVGYWDVISQAPMATAHAIARFFVPMLCEFQGWALFTDGDVLFRRDVSDLFRLADPQYAIQVVPHSQNPTSFQKMDGQAQTWYYRKNWSSVMLWNCGHPAHRALPTLVNAVPGRDLHRFCWLRDAQIGVLPPEWNVLIGDEELSHPEPAIAHFTLGLPDMPGYADQPFAEEWFAMARRCGYRRVPPAAARA